MHLLIKRTELQDERTFGELYIDGTFYFHTLEDKVRPHGEKVKGKTAIPAGVYKVLLTMSNRFKRLLPLLLDVFNFLGVRIHRGNTELDTDGCILVGTERDSTRVLKSTLAEKWLVKKIEEAIVRGEEISLTITNPA